MTYDEANQKWSEYYEQYEIADKECKKELSEITDIFSNGQAVAGHNLLYTKIKRLELIEAERVRIRALMDQFIAELDL